MSDEKLKPCPFCGGSVELNYIGNKYYITCFDDGCGAEFNGYNKEKMVKRWNTRSADESQLSEITGLKLALDKLFEKFTDYEQVVNIFTDEHSAGITMQDERTGKEIIWVNKSYARRKAHNA